MLGCLQPEGRCVLSSQCVARSQKYTTHWQSSDTVSNMTSLYDRAASFASVIPPCTLLFLARFSAHTFAFNYDVDRQGKLMVCYEFVQKALLCMLWCKACAIAHTCKDLLLEVNALYDSLHNHVHSLEVIIGERALQLGQQLVHLLLIHLSPLHLTHQVGLHSAQPSLPGSYISVDMLSNNMELVCMKQSRRMPHTERGSKRCLLGNSVGRRPVTR